MSTYHYDTMPDEVLRRDFVPDVYQHDIYMIDYQRLKDAGIKLISFDIDDTIAGLEDFTASKEAKILIQKLRNMGFEIVLLTNAKDTRGSHFGKVLGVDYIARAKKPLSKNFELLQERYGLEKNQMAHVGNSQINDIAGGNIFGIIIRRYLTQLIILIAFDLFVVLTPYIACFQRFSKRMPFVFSNHLLTIFFPVFQPSRIPNHTSDE